MALLFLKNLATFVILMFLLLIEFVTNATVSSPTCDIYTNGSRYCSCVKISNASNEEMGTIEIPLYDYSYTYILCTAIIFLFACFLNDDIYNPFAARYFDKVQETIDYTFEDLTDEVVKLIRFNTEMKFVMKDAAKHLFDVLHMLVHAILSYVFSFYIALNMGYTVEEAKYEFFPSVKKCSFEHWPFQGECKVSYGDVLKGVFIVLWMWFFISSLVIISYVIMKIRKCSQTKKKLKNKSFASMEAWLIDLCQEDIIHLNRMSCYLRMKSFEEAAKRLVQEVRVKKLGPEDIEVEAEPEADSQVLLVPNHAAKFIISNPWAS